MNYIVVDDGKTGKIMTLSSDGTYRPIALITGSIEDGKELVDAANYQAP